MTIHIISNSLGLIPQASGKMVGGLLVNEVILMTQLRKPRVLEALLSRVAVLYILLEYFFDEILEGWTVAVETWRKS